MDLVYFAIFYSLGQETRDACYTEEDVQYKMKEDGLNLEIATTPASAEECRTYCRHLFKNPKILLYGRMGGYHIIMNFIFLGTPMMKQSTSPSTRAIPNADVSHISTWMSAGERKVAESLAMWIVMTVSSVIPTVNLPSFGHFPYFYQFSIFSSLFHMRIYYIFLIFY